MVVGWAGFSFETISFSLFLFHPGPVIISCRVRSLYTRGRWSPRYCALGLETRIQRKAERRAGWIPPTGALPSWRSRYSVCIPSCSDSESWKQGYKAHPGKQRCRGLGSPLRDTLARLEGILQKGTACKPGCMRTC